MRVVLQRVSAARVVVAGEVVGEVGRGWLALLAVGHGDAATQANWLAEKIANLRAFPDADGKMNRSVQDVSGAVLAVSNFTLYADCQKGRRPSFIDAARPEVAEPLYRAFCDALRALGVSVAEGRFGADMRVELTNDGPVTFVIDTAANPS
jgi:D-tyrosyl-tRNA(Tyr) deacylase